LAATVAAVLAGCNPELDQYRRMALGRPLDKNVTLTSTSAPSQLGQASAKQDVFLFALPSIVAVKTLGVLVDRDGKLVAKRYTETAMEHWLLAQLGACRWYMEVEVPAELFQDVPEGWKNLSPSGYAMEALRYAARPLAEGLGDDQRDVLLSSSDSPTESLAVVDMPINPRRLRPGVLQRLTEKDPTPLVELERDLDLAGTDVTKFRALASEFRLAQAHHKLCLRAICRSPLAANVLPEYLDRVIAQIEQALPPTDHSEANHIWTLNYPFCFYFHGRTQWPGYFAGRTEAFAGVTREGFDRRIDFHDGSRARIRNLGNRRIQIEFEFFCLTDPLTIGPMIELRQRDFPPPTFETHYQEPAHEDHQH
jgi:hypothetical protein